MVVTGDCCQKDPRLVGREFHRRKVELVKERSQNLRFEVRDGKERQRWLDEQVS